MKGMIEAAVFLVLSGSALLSLALYQRRLSRLRREYLKTRFKF